MPKLHIFGDSYSTPGYYVEPRDSWWGLVAHDLQNQIDEVVNWSWPGNNIDSIAHIIVSNSEIFRPDDYLIIGIPPLQRLTMFNPDKEIWPKKVLYDQNLLERDREDILCHRGLAQYVIHEMDKQYVILLDSFISNQLDCKKFVFLNLSVPFQPLTEWPVLNCLQKNAYANKRMILFDNTYYSVNLEKHQPADFDTHGWMGHHGPKGNHHWYESVVKSRITELGWLKN